MKMDCEHLQWYILSTNRTLIKRSLFPLHSRHNGHGNVSNRQLRHYLLNRLFRRRSKKTSKLRVTGLCAGNSSVTGEFPAQMASCAENVSIWWRHHPLSRSICPHKPAVSENIYRMELSLGAPPNIEFSQFQNSNKIQIQKPFIQENTQTYVEQSWDWNPWGFIRLIISWVAITLRTF